MKKFSLIAAGLIASVSLSLNAATVATVDGEKISDTEVNEFYAPMLRGQDFKKLPEEQQKALIQQYVMQDLILKDAKKQNLEKDPMYIKGLERAKDELLLNVYQNKMIQDIKVDAAKIKEAYEKNKEQFVKPARVKAKHILVTSEQDAKNIINELKNLKAKDLENKFAQIAREKSIDTGSAANGGDLGWFDESTMVKPFTDATFSLKKGEITKTPVKTNFGYHIILKQDSRAKEQVAFKDAKMGIENRLKFEEFQKRIALKGQELYKNAKVEIK
ncbi:peptidylprolyl isomerase [Campylobacter upsaliensis]|uniref:peptidylprolyl isomerase n=1 Tax=Campylobacter upsaliensis TaxID=28080 RepID=UPI0022EB289D|nr:peptidylprolyl isomerase [Campylobacter upsaliensis]